MKFRSLFCVIIALFALISCAHAQDIEQRYVTRWNVEPIARMSMDKKLIINGTRCRIDDDGPYKDKWLSGRTIGDVLGKTTWHVELASILPGTYNVTFDLRTPTGAEWIPGALRVPQIARHTGKVGRNLSAPKAWPQDLHPRIENDKGPVEFAWDRDNLYIRPAAAAAKPCELTLDLLPASPDQHTKNVKVAGVTTLTWADLFPAGPFTGEALRYRVNDGKWTDLLLVGSGSEQHYAANIVSNPPGGDDQGPPEPVLNGLLDMSGLDCRNFSIAWRDVEPNDPGDKPSLYDWSWSLRNVKYQFDGMTYCSISLISPWAEPMKTTDPARYWKLAERFVREAAKQAAAFGITHFSLGYNEPEMFFRSDKEAYFNENLTHMANAVREAVPGCKVIAGKFAGGYPATIRLFNSFGFKDNFDILDIHTYNNDPPTGTSMGEIVACHEALDELGMGKKQIFLGEGWGPTRDLGQAPRKKWDEPVSPAEADFMRQHYQNGYRSLVSARVDYSPDWVLGAKFFTLNDNIGSTYWKQSAKPVLGANGELQYYMIGLLRFDKGSSFDARFFNGGLIDFQGNPKGPWFFDFPPALPEVRFLATGSPDYVLEGEWYTINVTVVNANPRPITDLKISARDRSAQFKGEISAELVGESERASLAPGEIWKTAVRMRVDRCEPRKLRQSVEMSYKYDAEEHYVDDTVPTEVRMPLQVKCEPARIVLNDGKPQTIAVTVLNNKREGATLDAVDFKGQAFTVTSDNPSFTLPQGASKTLHLTVTPRKTEPGSKPIPVITGSDASLLVVTPLPCPQLQTSPVIDGDLSDWPREAVAQGAIVFGKSITKSERPPSDPFPIPPPINQPGVSNIAKEEAKAPKFGANAAIAWRQDGLYLGVVVEDNSFKQDYTGTEVWMEDSVQIAIDPLSDGGLGTGLYGEQPGYRPDDREIALALTGFGPQVTCIHAPNGTTGAVNGAKLAAKHDGKFTVYEAVIPWSEVLSSNPKAGQRFGFDILINNLEGADRFSIGWADGIGRGKYPGRYVPIILQ